MIGKTILHYKILEKLGEGGMGVVYKAEDTKLERTVALKFLSLTSIGDEEKKRFKREAKAAASLNHPNIATIYAIEEVEDDTFIVMEYIKGKELRELTTDDRELSIEDATNYATQIAEGLKAAHKKGVTHRDIKSSNIMITDENQVKIMDFGLAKVRGGAQLTKSGMTMGTAAYMSPEQAQGIAVDHRTDIWAFAVVFYEMLTGEQPFKGDYEQAVTYSIMNEDPEPPTALRTGVPMELERIVLKALAKETSERYQNVQDVLVDLKRAKRRLESEKTSVTKSVAKSQKGRNFAIYAGIVVLILLLVFAVFYQLPDRSEKIESLAVLPFINIARDTEQEYFVDGMTVALITELSKIKSLRTISRTSVMQYKNTRKSLNEIADELGVDAIIEGSVLRSNDRVRITVQLVKANPERHLWAEAYDRELRDILEISSDVTTSIVREIKATLTPQEESRLTDTRSVNPAAHEAYLRGHYHWNKRTIEGLQTSVRHFEKAIELDPEYALPYVGLSEAYHFLHIYGTLSPSEAFPKAMAAAEKALARDERLAEAHTAYAALLVSYHLDWEGAEKAYRRAIELNPGHARTHHLFAIMLSEKGEFDEAVAEIQRAKALDPLSLIINTNLGFPVYAFARRYQDAFDALYSTLELNPDYWLAHHWLGVLYAVTGESEKSITHMERAGELSSNFSLTIGMLAYAHACAGHSTRARELLLQLQARSGDEYIFPYELALIHAAFGDMDKAFALLEDAFQQKDGWLRFMNSDPRIDPLRGDSRFNKMLTKISKTAFKP